MEFLEISEAEYDVFASNHPQANFLSSLAAYNIRKKAGNEHYLVGVKKDGEIIAATFLIGYSALRMFRYFYAPRGFLMDYQDQELVTYFIKEVTSFLKDKKAIYIKFDPYVRFQEHDKNGDVVQGGFHHQDNIDNVIKAGGKHGGFTTGFSDNNQVRWMMMLDLQGHEEASLLKNMDTLRRRMIKKLANGYVKVRELDISELQLFEDIVNDTSLRKGFLNRELEFYRNLWNEFSSQHIKVPLAYLDIPAYQAFLEDNLQSKMMQLDKLVKLNEKKQSEKGILKVQQQEASIATVQAQLQEAQTLRKTHGKELILSTAFFVNYGHEVLYLSGGSYQAYHKFNGAYAIQWYMIKYALENHYASYNFYGTSGDFHKNASDYGVFEFKRGFNATAVELLGDFIVPVHPLLFALYNAVKHVV